MSEAFAGISHKGVIPSRADGEESPAIAKGIPRSARNDTNSRFASAREKCGFAALAELFRYPDGPLHLDDARLNDDARGELDAFAREIAALDRGQLEATYTSTFDLAPSCSPYLGAHLFGDEGPDRGRLLVGLRASYARAGMDFDEGELPDHVAEVLAFAAHEEAEEWSDLVRLILIPALTKMDDLVRASSNPYRHLIAAARQTCEAALCEGSFRGGE